ncbi:colanic acid biosynthesis glycosyltransferase WcaL [Erythrobacteraceae bacterium CFH 75059]|uniref:glycosyltransferase n=1 Tax=Qipengyuania thermophila TaxID=2509361 RepID=UPI00101E901A|nr:glycosyltransferase [Qipengyuania thermophila]TCD06874.1 colanic acid biosynthesis glycosyltransferase WcaL [Erythrobacteraceae bacterium CFH 75059]
MTQHGHSNGDDVASGSLAVTYLLNQYPAVSHSFIRTEILALERLGVRVERLAMRGWENTVVDPLDAAERERTRYVLEGGPAPLLKALLRVVFSRPGPFLQALKHAWTLSRGAERSFLHHLIYLAEACLVLEWVETGSGAHHVHAHFGSNAATVAFLVKSLGGPPFSFTVHGPEEFDKPHQLKLGVKVRDASFVAAITSFCRSQLFRWSRLSDWEKIRVVHCALDPRINATPPQPLPQDFGVLCVGRLCEQKGQVLLIEAIRLLRDRGTPIPLILAGDGEMRKQLEEAIQAAELAELITITGWVNADEVRELLDRSSALVLPSFAEGLPVVIMEAMSRARPVVTTAIAGIPELVRHGVDGLIVPAGDAEAFADAMAAMSCLSRERLAEMGAAARERVLARHFDTVEAAKLASLFQQSFSGLLSPQHDVPVS